MSRLQAIENALKSINEAVFQELCDSFLAIRNRNYAAFSRTGSQSGKQKTTKGTPDTFLLLPNGKYIFVEYSTNITSGLPKLEDDIKKCIDISKTGIPIDQIDEIIICINFNLQADEIQSLKSLLADTRIVLTIYLLDYLAIELHLHHRDLTHQYLGLALDTGQIVSIERFIEEYNRASQGISTPLDNPFLHRETELKELINSIHHYDFIILTGPPGIGKTKLALEAIKSFLSDNLSFTAYCVSYKNHTLLDDLYQYFDAEKDYLLFVDDANRIDAFSQITGFYKSTRNGKLKIIITVRDYAFQEIGVLCQEFLPQRINLTKFSDEQIIDIIKSDPFQIRNDKYQKEIVRIADGNPKLAIMTALLAKAKQNIYALSDVSDLFEKYFSTFIKDDGEFANVFNIKCLGLIAFFYTIPYKNKEIATSILDNFEIKYNEFIDAIDKLENLELVDIQFEHVKIPEQNLSTYFFYKAFIKDNLLSFEILLNKYFSSNSNHFRDCVIPANNTFGWQNVMDKLKPELLKHWNTIKEDEEKAFKFLNTFWYYLPAETLAFVFSNVEAMPTVSVSRYEVTYESNAFSNKHDKVIELLGEFFRYPDNLKDVIELAFEYTRKSPDHLPELIHEIRELLTFDEDDRMFQFIRQTILFEILMNGLKNSDALYSAAFYELSKIFLSFKYHHTKGGRNLSFYWYDYSIPNIQPIQEFRKNIWNALESNYDRYPNESFNLLKSYASASPYVIKEVMEFEIPFLLEVIKKYLNNASFEHCRYVQDQIRWCKRNSVSHPAFSSLSQKFINKTYETFLKIDWDRFRDKEMFEFDDYREYEKLKEAEIRTSFIFNSLSDIQSFYKEFVYLKKIAKNDWNYLVTIDYVIDENCIRNFELGCDILKLIIENGNEINFIPRVIFFNHLKKEENVKAIWAIIQDKEFKNRVLWELSFYDCLDSILISIKYAESIINTVSRINESITIHFDRLERYLTIEPNLFQNILKIIVEKNEKEGIQLQLWMDFFSSYFDKLSDDIELIKKAYLQQEKIHSFFDYEGKGIINIIKSDPKFLVEYVDSLYSEDKHLHSAEHRNLSFVWQVENIEPVLEKVFDLVLEKEPYFGILDHFCNSFFRNQKNDLKEKSSGFLIEYCKANNNNYNKMNIIVDIVRHSMGELFEDILLLFLSLNQDVDVFSNIYWRGNGGSVVGNVNLGDIEAAEWRNILAIVEKSTVGIKLLPIKKYINEQIEHSLRYADWERQRRFLERY